jgi:outer membrane protein assembly factor BamB
MIPVALGGAAVLLKKLDLERFQQDPRRMQKLQATPLGTRTAALPNGTDWPQWRGPNRDGLSIETGLKTCWPEGGPPVLWRKQIGHGFSSVAVVGPHVYTMAQEGDEDGTGPADSSQVCEAVLCLNADNGQEIWRHRYPNHYDERFGSGPRSTPAVDGNLVYAVGPTGIFSCLRADTGTEVWRHDLLKEFGGSVPRYGMAFSPLVEGDLVYTMPGGPAGHAVAAFDKHTGKLAWKALDDPIGYSSPVESTAGGVRQILFFTNTALVSLSPQDGHVHWRYPWETPGGFNIVTPLAMGNYVFISSAYAKGCALVEVSAVPDRSLSANTVYEHNRMRNYFASSVLYDGHVYGFDNSSLACMDLRTGKILWREAGNPTFKKGSLLIADGHLIVLSEYGRLHLAEATPEGYREKATFQVSADKCWTAPVLAGGRLFVRAGHQLICLDLRH